MGDIAGISILDGGLSGVIENLLNLPGSTLYWIVFGVLMACGLGIPIPEDITLIMGGAFCYYGKTDVWAMITVGMVGVLLGDSIIFLLGAKYGRKLTQKWFFSKVFTPKRLDLAQEKLLTKGNKLIFAARFMPGLRAPIYFSSGTLGLPFRKFLFFDGLAALLSVPAIVWSAYFFGDELDRVIQLIRNTEHGILGLIIGIALFIGIKWYIQKRRSGAANHR